MKKQPRGHGLIIEPIDIDNDYLYGSARSTAALKGDEIINPSGDWRPYVPPFEAQSAPSFETNACVTFSTLNNVEMLNAFLFAGVQNLSDRFAAKLSGTDPKRGATHKQLGDFIRHNWSCFENEWPFVASLEEYYGDVPAHLKVLAKARGAEFDFTYDRITGIAHSTLREALKRGTVGISVPAWQHKDGLYYRPQGWRDNHAVALLYVHDDGRMVILDQYEPFIKTLHADCLPEVAYVYSLRRQIRNDSAWPRFLAQIYAWILGIQLADTPVKREETPLEQPKPAEPTPEPPQQLRRLIEAIIQVESGGDVNAIGDRNLTHKAYGCMQIRQPVCDDVNRAFGTNYKAQDMLGNRSLSEKVFRLYMSLWATEEKLGRPVADQDRARIWNGGPTGYRKGSTVLYWSKVQKHL